MNARMLVLAAALAMGFVEIAAIFVEAVGALVLAALFLLLALWLWRRDSVWPVGLLGLLFALEIVYLFDYDWGVTADRVMLILTVAISGGGLAAVALWLARRRSVPR